MIDARGLEVSEVEIIYKTTQKASERPTIKRSLHASEIFYKVYDPNKIAHKEFFYAMYLNNANAVLSVMKVSEGSINGTICDPIIILQAAIKLNAQAIILSHNHPSGNLTPSESDKRMTQKIKQGAELFSIRIHDHIILTPENEYFSFADDGLI
jgi:DNA repair protein RadC